MYSVDKLYSLIVGCDLLEHVPIGCKQEQTANIGHLERCGGRQDADQLVSRQQPQSDTILDTTVQQ